MPIQHPTMTTTSKVQQVYRDHALVTEGEAVVEALLQCQQLGDQKPSCNLSDSKFPVKLHHVLGELEKDGLSHIVSWQPHGRCFLVHKRKAFVKRILPL